MTPAPAILSLAEIHEIFRVQGLIWTNAVPDLKYWFRFQMHGPCDRGEWIVEIELGILKQGYAFAARDVEQSLHGKGFIMHEIDRMVVRLVRMNAPASIQRTAGDPLPPSAGLQRSNSGE